MELETRTAVITGASGRLGGAVAMLGISLGKLSGKLNKFSNALRIVGGLLLISIGF